MRFLNEHSALSPHTTWDDGAVRDERTGHGRRCTLTMRTTVGTILHFTLTEEIAETVPR